MKRSRYTRRLRVKTVTDSDVDPAKYLELFNSNPDFIDASTQHIGQSSYDISDIEMHLYQEMNRENSFFLEASNRFTSEMLAHVTLLVPNPGDGIPWIGLLIVHGDHQRRGVGTVVVREIERRLTEDGWQYLRIATLRSSSGAARFLRAIGFKNVREGRDQDNRAVVIVEKHLA